MALKKNYGSSGLLIAFSFCYAMARVQGVYKYMFLNRGAREANRVLVLPPQMRSHKHERRRALGIGSSTLANNAEA
jgi:hypothetical protein